MPANKRGIIGDVITDALIKYPSAPTLTLAKFLHKTYPELFVSIENARTNIRRYRGNCGDKQRKKVTDKSHFIPPGEDRKSWNVLPKGQADSWDPYILPDGVYLVVADLHVPYHDATALQISMDYGRENGAKNVLIDGDGLDFYQVSRFLKDPRKRSVQQEIETMWLIWDCLQEQIGQVFYKIGNHDIRVVHYLWRSAPALCGIKAFEIASILETKERGVELIESSQIAKAGRLPVIHGHEYMRGMSSPVNPARGYFLRAIDNVLGAHYHRPSSHTERTIDGREITTWSLGCMCDLHPEYAVLNNWSHGFAILKVDGDSFEVQNKRIASNGRVLSV